MDQVQGVYDMFIGLLRASNTPGQAESTMLSLGISPELVRAAVKRFKTVAERIITAREPEALLGEHLVPWYTGARPGDLFWPALSAHLRSDGFDEGGLEAVNLASNKVVANLPPPWEPEFSGRGLVLGYVQSGKTTNFTAVAAKAADAGYRLIVVLSGIHNSLRRQTQTRLNEQLLDLNRDRWVELTDSDNDFGSPPNADALISQTELRILAVIKKHPLRLRNLIRWLSEASELARRNCPILVIDDEADQASVNSKGPDQRAVINKLILQLLSQPKIAYVGYTATPFANIFIDPSVPEDLYPRDFIVDLPRPSAYFGPERLFGREPLTEEEYESGQNLDGLDAVRYIGDEEARTLRPPRKRTDRADWIPPITDSLGVAVRYFLLATAARRARGHAGRHSSMLIHTTQFADLHHRYRDPLLGELRSISTSVESGKTDDLERLWEKESERVPAQSVGEEPVAFAELVSHLEAVLDDVEIVVDNYLSDVRLVYGDEPKVVIAIGGNTLSRGLTLEGLVVSFFLRSAGAYDTLLQMGRWFGFRGGYADLPRIWTTKELAEYFQHLATVEAEIRVDVARYERELLTPREFAVRVRTHPKLAITSALKMQAVINAQVSYSGRRLQTIIFEHHDREWLLANQRAARRLVSAAGGPAVDSVGRGRYLYRYVSHQSIDDFLAEYRFHPDSQDLVADNLRRYIAGQVARGELVDWHVGIVGREDAAWGHFDLGTGPDNPVGLINRSAVRAVAKPHANIKSLMSHEDRVFDLGMPPDAVKNLTDSELQELRPRGIGLLILYPINKDSFPQRNGESRVALDAVEHVMGLGLVFPDSSDPGWAVDYKSVALPEGDVDEPDEINFDEIDTEGSLDELRRR